MAKFKSKPVVIEAEQWFPGKQIKGVHPGDGRPGVNVESKPHVITIHGAPCPVKAGDWIVPEPDGKHFYPIKPDIFAKKYEPAE